LQNWHARASRHPARSQAENHFEVWFNGSQLDVAVSNSAGRVKSTTATLTVTSAGLGGAATRLPMADFFQ